MTSEFAEFEFHYAKCTLQPYAGETKDSNKLVKEIIESLNNSTVFPIEKREIDRHAGRANSVPRRLVHISSSFKNAGQRVFGRIALIKNKAPKLWAGKDLVEEIQKKENQQFIEITNYVIHFDLETGIPIIMIEFNSSGPRLSDVEYYFRQVSSEVKIATSIKFKYLLDLEYSELDKITNIFNVTVKVDSAKLISLKSAKWYHPFKNLSDESGFKDVRMEMFFGKRKEKGVYKKNIKGLEFARSIVDWLKSKEKNIEYVEDLKMEYELADGFIGDLDFLKNKISSFVYVQKNTDGLFKKKAFRQNIGLEFNKYLSIGETSQQKLSKK